MVSSKKDVQTEKGRSKDHRDFPRLHVEAKVRIANSAAEGSSEDQPAIISDLSLGGARLATPAVLQKGAGIGVIPFSGLLKDHPLHRVLEFQVMWAGGAQSNEDGQPGWQEYGLAHKGSVLDVLNSWLGHLLLRRRADEELLDQRREQRRVTFKDGSQSVRARLSHNSALFDLRLLDIAPRGLLAQGDTDEIPVGVHLELKSGWDDSSLDPDHDQHLASLLGCVVDAHSHSGSTFYRVAFDPESELDEENLVNWAQSVGGEFEL